MFVLGRLSEKTIIAILLIIFLLMVALFGISYLRNQPFTIYGKEFGFGSDELRKVTAELKTFREESSRNLDQIQQLLVEAKKENLKLKEENMVLISQQEDRLRQAAALWFPIDTLDFFVDGTFSTQDGRQGRGKWASKESELTLKLIGIDDGDVLLETNLLPPENKIRIQSRHQLLIHMIKWDYLLTSKDVYSDNATIRVERRKKPGGA